MKDESSTKNIDILRIGMYDQTKELGKNIGLEATVDIICLLDEQPRQYKEIASSIKLPHTTLERRLKMLQTLHIIKKKPITSNRRETHAYNLTIMGMELMKFFKIYEKTMTLPASQQKVIEIENNK